METVTIECGAGTIVGRRDGQAGVLAFKGIPYAEPPVGNLRWRPPVAKARFAEPFDAGGFCAACAQQSSVIFGPIGRVSEDCLALNIWCSENLGQRKPVMVWLHGGGFTTGNSASPIYIGQNLAQLDVVVVSINYRLGPFGFFAHPELSHESEHNVSGNYGLLDQWLALQWIKTNIAAFGGDPDCVTLFGESAGAASMLRHLVSPQAAGLFHRAIMQSQGPITPHRHLKEEVGNQSAMESAGLALTRQLGLADATAITQLRSLSAAEILDKTQPAQGPFADGERYAPVVDGWLIPDDPLKLIASGNWHRMPILVGTNRDEGTIFVPQIPHQDDADYRRFLHKLLGSNELAQLAANRWPADAGSNSEHPLRGLIADWIAAVAFDYPVEQIIDAILQDRTHHSGSIADESKSAIYRYHFERVPGTEMAKRAGAFHSLEIGYVFGTIMRAPKGYDAVDYALAQQMMRCWVSFAYTGSPVDPDQRQVTWPAVTESNRQAGINFGVETTPTSLHANPMVQFAMKHLKN